MPSPERARAASAFLFSLAFLTAVAAAQLGEVAGGLNLNTSVGGSNSINLTIFNGGNSYMGYQIVPPTLSAIANETTPAVVLSPMNGTMAPHSQIRINVTVSVSGKDKPGLMWQGLIQIIGASAANSTGGAQLQAGLGKVLTVYSVAPEPLEIPYALIGGIVIVVAAGGCAYYFIARKRKASPKKKL